MADALGRVLVTGGTGYLGSWCVVRLLQDGWQVRATVRAIRFELGRTRQVSSESALALGWTPRPVAQTLADSARSLAALGVV